MPANDRRKLLQLIIDDPSNTDQERTEAQRALDELTADQSRPSRRKYGRNGNLPQTQADQDADIEAHFRNLHDDALTQQDRTQIERELDPQTQLILDAFFSELAALYTRHDTELPLLISSAKRTQSDFVRAKTLRAIRAIAGYSQSEVAKRQAQEFLQQSTQENQ
jgi:hypothetical protein